MRIKLKYTYNVSLYIEGETLHVIKTNRAKWIGLFVGIIAVITCIWGSIIFGYTNTSWKLALDAFSILMGPMNILLFKMCVYQGH